MRVLIVGAGSVGQIYGHFFQRGQAEVDVYIRPRYVDDAQEGYRLYDRKRGLRSPEVFTPDGICTSADEVKEKSYDVIVLCIPSDGLRGPWFPDFAAAIGDATLISLSPGIEDRQFVLDHVAEDQFASGLITSVSYPAPLEGEEVEEPGTAYWFPPMAPALFQGPADRLKPAVDALNRGGMKSKIVTDLDEKSGFGSGVLMPVVATLETVDWSFERLGREKERRELLTAAVDETLTLIENLLDTKRPLPTRFLSPITWKGALMVAPSVPPFDLERYLQLHFTKVGAQTRQFFKDYIEHRRRLDMDSPALETLLTEIGESP